MMKTVRVGTRGSRLAIAQTEIALAALRKVHPQIRFEIIAISTKGDVDKRPLFTLDEKGIFEKEVNEAVKQGKVEFAVHSLMIFQWHAFPRGQVQTMCLLPTMGKN